MLGLLAAHHRKIENLTEFNTAMDNDREALDGTAHLVAPGPARSLLSYVYPVVHDLGFSLVRVRMTGEAGAPVLQVMAEREDGLLGIDECEAISTALSAVLDVEDPIHGEYTLEVSSPGLARPLTRAVDFERWQGHEAKLEVAQSVDGQRRFRGIVAGFVDGEALLEVELAGYDTPQVLGFGLRDITEARLIITDEVLKLALKGAKSPE